MVRTEQDYQIDKEAVEELGKAFEDNKLNTEDEPINDENILIKLFPIADITLSKKSKGRISATKILHLMNMHQHQNLMEDEIWTLYIISHTTFKIIQIVFKFGGSTWAFKMKKDPFKITALMFVENKLTFFFKSSSISGHGERCPAVFQKVYLNGNSFPFNH